MKAARLILVSMLPVIMAACGEGNKQPAEKIITVDVKASYPEKEVVLQDFADVEYVPLETNDEFITQGDVKAIGKKYILVKNWSNDGNIFVFDRKTGKGIRKINRKGQGAEEYTFINAIVLDEDNDEIFVNCAPMKKIFVYDLAGNFKRSFEHLKDAEYLEVFNYDNNHLICYDISGYYKDGELRSKPYHAIISKQDGSLTRNIPIPFEKIKAPTVQEGEGMAVTSVNPIVPYHDNWLLVETSSDTVYNYISKENKLSPFLVKTPSKDPVIFLTMGTLTDRFYFMTTIKKVFNFKTGRGFPFTDLMYDKQENAIFNANVWNGDYVKKERVNMTARPLNGEIATLQVLAANQLVEAHKNDGLKGKLKEIAATLDEESNPVIMLVKYKK
ncbi:6-bladed beta-propeller [Parabacteroides pacaensis]|uniref:6-bladed beta-propeller n=1 Tax=Parabacteroides pacaensis TaxID=2086575 RepID=UPI000D10F0C1|nr:6-bladed beta-propeller [Parabacteroides pacaensis]